LQRYCEMRLQTASQKYCSICCRFHQHKRKFCPLLSYNIQYMKAGTKCNVCDSHLLFFY
jgi:hypothetical protein